MLAVKSMAIQQLSSVLKNTLKIKTKRTTKVNHKTKSFGSLGTVAQRCSKPCIDCGRIKTNAKKSAVTIKIKVTNNYWKQNNTDYTISFRQQIFCSYRMSITFGRPCGIGRGSMRFKMHSLNCHKSFPLENRNN